MQLIQRHNYDCFIFLFCSDPVIEIYRLLVFYRCLHLYQLLQMFHSEGDSEVVSILITALNLLLLSAATVYKNTVAAGFCTVHTVYVCIRRVWPQVHHSSLNTAALTTVSAYTNSAGCMYCIYILLVPGIIL